MTVNEKIKTTDNKIEPNKVQSNLDRQKAKISGNVGKYEFVTVKDMIMENELLGKAATINRFNCSSLGR